MKEQKIELGDKVKDPVTGFVGIAVANTSYLHGCNRIAVQPKKKKDNELPEAYTFDEPQLEVIQRKKVKKGTTKTGGYKPDYKHYFKK